MGKKESLKLDDSVLLEPPSKGLAAKISGASSKTFAVIKFILGLGLLPFVYSSTVSFLNEFSLISKALQGHFWTGAITFLAIYLFVWEPVIIYTKGQQFLEFGFSFFKPLVRVAPYVLPIYTIILFLILSLVSLFTKSDSLYNYFIFLFGFTMSLHLVFSAKTIRGRKGDFLKGNYIFGFSFVYILDLLLLALFLNLLFDKFSFVDFFNNAYQIARNIFYAVFKQLFVF